MPIFQPLFRWPLLPGALRFLTRASRFLSRQLAMADYRLTDGRGTDAGQRAGILKSALSHDMYGHPDERHYRDQYWTWIEKSLSRLTLGRNSLALDLGCGQGRLTTLLSRVLGDGRVIGVDISGAAVAAARKHAEELGLQNVEFRVCPIREELLNCPDGSADVVVMTEVTFFHPEWKIDLGEIKRVLRQGGIACIGFRSQYFDALCIVRDRILEQARMLLDRRSGNLFGGDVEFTWQTSSEVRCLLCDELGLNLLALVGIGCCSGIAGDPHASIARPFELDEDERRDLMQLELAIGAEVPDAGRYMLAIASKGAPG